jgi:hypothetical protein
MQKSQRVRDHGTRELQSSGHNEIFSLLSAQAVKASSPHHLSRLPGSDDSMIQCSLKLNAQTTTRLEGPTLANLCGVGNVAALRNPTFVRPQYQPTCCILEYHTSTRTSRLYINYLPHTIPNLSLLKQEDTETVDIISDETDQVSSNNMCRSRQLHPSHIGVISP